MCNDISGTEILLIVIAIFAGIIKLRMVQNESRATRYDFCNGIIVIEREVMNMEEQLENHDAIDNVSSS